MHPTVLIIDNQVDVAMQIQRDFASRQFPVQLEYTLLSAKQVMREDSFAVVIFRLQMSDVGEVLNSVKQFGRNENSRRIAVLDQLPRVDETFQRSLRAVGADAAFLPVLQPDERSIVSQRIIDFASRGYFSDKELATRSKIAFLDLGMPIRSVEGPVSRSRREG
jgi:PleD family two-component response regulator